MTVPPQKYKVGDLVRVTERVPYTPLDVGDVLLVIDAFCEKVCIKAGLIDNSPENGGAEYGMEWGYIGSFAKMIKGYRFGNPTPMEVIS
jgi:hypothetical protein